MTDSRFEIGIQTNTEVSTMSQSIKDKVKALEEKNRLITENLVDAVWVVDAKTLIYEYITPSINRISGYTADELIGTSILERLTPESSARALIELEKGLSQHARGKFRAQSMELELVHKSGDTYWVEIRAKLAQEPDMPSKIIGITRDITIQKRAEQRLEAMNKKLREVIAAKEQLQKEIGVLRQLLPICSGCKRIRDDDAKWWPLDAYMRAHTNSDFTHTICPDCKDVLYPELNQ